MSTGIIPQYRQAGSTSTLTASGIFRWIYCHEINIEGVMIHSEASTVPGNDAANSFQLYKGDSQMSITPNTLLIGYNVAGDLVSGAVDNVVIGPSAGLNLSHSRVITATGRTAGDNILHGVANTCYGEDTMGLYGIEVLGARGITRLFAQAGPPLVPEPLMRDPRSPTEVVPAVDARLDNMFVTGDLTSATLYHASELDRSRTLAGGISSFAGAPYYQVTWGQNSAFGSNALQVLGGFSQFNTGLGAQAGGNIQWGDNNTLVGHFSAGRTNISRCQTVIGTSAALNMAVFTPADVARFPVPADPKTRRFDFFDIAEEVSYNTVVGCRAGDRITLNPAAYVRANPTDGSTSNVRNSVLIGHGVCSPYVYSGAAALTGPYNTVVGSHAAPALTTGLENVISGFYAAPLLTTGSDNVIIGSGTPAWQMVNQPFGEGALGEGWVFDPASNPTITTPPAAALTTGSNNVIIGKGAGAALTTGSANVAIGLNAAISGAISNAIALGVGSTAVYADSAAIGRTATTTAANVLQIGAPAVPMRISESAPAHTSMFAPVDIAAGVAMTWQSIQGGILTGTPGAAVLLTTPTAAAIYTNVVPGATANQGVHMKVINLDANPANTYTVTAGDANVTISGNPIIAGAASAELIFVVTNPAVPTIVIYM